MSTLGNRIRSARVAKGLKQRQIAERFGIARASVSQWEADDTRPDGSKIAELSYILGVSVDWLLDDGDIKENVLGSPENSAKALQNKPRPEVSEPVALPEESEVRMPILGTANGGMDGAIIFDGEPIGWAKMPDSLVGVRSAYAVYVHGESMVPRYRPGERLEVHPNKPPKRFDDVIVQLYSEDPHGPLEGYVKEYITQTPSVLVVKQYNPEKEIEYPLKRIKAVHVVVGMKRD